MNITELENKLLEIGKEAEKQKTKLRIQYANEHNPYKIGDIVEDHYHIIKIQGTKSLSGDLIPSFIFYGIELTKKLKPKKRQETTYIYQELIKKKIKQGVVLQLSYIP